MKMDTKSRIERNTLTGIRVEIDMLKGFLYGDEDQIAQLTRRELEKASRAADRLTDLLTKASRQA